MKNDIITALITPFDDTNNIDYESLKGLVLKQIEDGIDGLLLLGTTAEVSSLTIEEQIAIVDFVYNLANKKIKLIINLSSNNTKEIVEKSKYYDKYDIDSFLVITPYYNKPNESGMYEHFNYIANNVSKPIILYNVPSRTGVNLSMSNILKLKKHKNIVGLKEASGDINTLQELISLQDDTFKIYNADDNLNYLSFALGVGGLMSVITNVISDVVVSMSEAYNNNEVLKARDLNFKYLKLTKLLFIETSPVMTKKLMNYLNYNVGNVRLPLGKPSGKNTLKLLNEGKVMFNT